MAMTQMGKHYGLPVCINSGLTDSKSADARAGLEIGVTLAMGAAAGADIFGHMGIFGTDQTASLDILTLQNEVIGYTESVLRQFTVSDETLGFDVIREVGPGGSFIDQEHTVSNFRKELWFLKLLNRDYYEAWKESGAVRTEERCRQRKEEILACHEIPPLPDDVSREIDGILAAARQEIALRPKNTPS